MLWQALTLQLGYNASLVAIGAALLGAAAGMTGTFPFLRKRALVSDAVSHATLPGLALAFIVMASFGGDGRGFLGLLAGSALSAALGLLVVHWLTTRTRLTEDAAIGAVLSVFFGFGIVLLTVIQTMSTGRQAGLDSLLLGSTAGMLFQDAALIALAGLATLVAVLVMRRPMIMTAFDPDFAATAGVNTARTDLLTMGLVLAVTVIGLKIVGLILVVALLIIPPVAARFWTDRTDHLAAIAALIGGVSGYVGSVISATAPALPTGPIIVLVAFALFVLSFFFAPARGLAAGALRQMVFRKRVHRRQGLLALAQGQPIFEALTRRILVREGYMRSDGVATEAGRARAARALRDEKRWEVVRASEALAGEAAQYDALTEIQEVLTPDQLAEVDRAIGAPMEVR